MSKPFSHYTSRAASSRRAGFTLVELSVVLVIISLLVGSIIAGTTLIRAARIKSITSDKEAYQNAILAFRDKYNALPGDMANATDIWGYATGATGPITSVKNDACEALTSPSTTKGTCNGNGNDIIYEHQGEYNHEQYRVWQHLSNAGMIEGSYSGVIDCPFTDSFCARPGVNTPVSAVPDATWFILNPSGEPAGRLTSTALWTNQIDKHLLFFGGTIVSNYGTAASNPFQPVLSPAEAWSIDDKFDDAFPGRGKIRAIANTVGTEFSTVAPVCVDTVTNKYNLIKTSQECTLYFYMPF